MTLTKEWLLKTISELEEERDATSGAVNEDAAMALAAMKLALASLTAEPVAYVDPFTLQNFATYRAGETDNKRMGREWMWADSDAGLVPVYAAPPAPVVQDIGEISVGRLPTMNQDDCQGLGDWWVQLRIGEDSDEVLARVYGATPREANSRAEALACRAAMLQGAEPVSNRDELTDGWVACSNRMPSPSTGVIVAAPWQSAPSGYAMKWATNCPGHPDADIDGWIIPGASWSPTHWMPLPAAPQQEVKK